MSSFEKMKFIEEKKLNIESENSITKAEKYKITPVKIKNFDKSNENLFKIISDNKKIQKKNSIRHPSQENKKSEDIEKKNSEKEILEKNIYKNLIKPKSEQKMIIYGLILSTAGINYGYTVNMFNNLFEPFIEEIHNIFNKDNQININSNLMFFFLLGGLISSLTASYLYVNFGRLKCHIFLNIFSIIISGILCFPNLYIIYICRFFQGYIGAFWIYLSLVMIKEIIFKRYIIFFSNSFYLFLTLGEIFAFGISTKSNIFIWQFIMFFPAIIEFIRLVIVIFFFKIKSPNYLFFKKSKNKNIRNILISNYKKFYSSKGSKILTDKFITYQKKKEEINKNVQITFKILFKKQYRRQFFFGLFLNFIYPLTGIVYTAYSTTIFIKLNIKNPELLTFILGFVDLSSGIFITIFGKKIGKRNPILISLFFQIIGNTFFILGFFYEIQILCILGFYLFCFFFAIFAGLLYPYLVDILPSVAISYACILRWFLDLLLSKYILQLIEKIGILIVFAIFVFFNILAIVVFYGFSIKTENKTSLQILEEFKHKKFFR